MLKLQDYILSPKCRHCGYEGKAAGAFSQVLYPLPNIFHCNFSGSDNIAGSIAIHEAAVKANYVLTDTFWLTLKDVVAKIDWCFKRDSKFRNSMCSSMLENGIRTTTVIDYSTTSESVTIIAVRVPNE